MNYYDLQSTFSQAKDYPWRDGKRSLFHHEYYNPVPGQGYSWQKKEEDDEWTMSGIFWNVTLEIFSWADVNKNKSSWFVHNIVVCYVILRSLCILVGGVPRFFSLNFCMRHFRIIRYLGWKSPFGSVKLLKYLGFFLHSYYHLEVIQYYLYA